MPLRTRAGCCAFPYQFIAQVDAETDLGETPLSCAGSAAVAQLLIDHGAS